jgi:hypothetical protein
VYWCYKLGKDKTVYFGNTYKDALNMGFDDEKGNNSDLKMTRVNSDILLTD